jgi:hypothetical protein
MSWAFSKVLVHGVAVELAGATAGGAEEGAFVVTGDPRSRSRRPRDAVQARRHATS